MMALMANIIAKNHPDKNYKLNLFRLYYVIPK